MYNLDRVSNQRILKQFLQCKKKNAGTEKDLGEKWNKYVKL
jgi:hypothetical protein